MPRHIAEVIRFKGGNEYRKGRVGGDVRPYESNERANKYIRSYIKHQSWKYEGIPKNAKNAKELAHVQDFVRGSP